jgi:hypothetical protein
MSNSKRSKYFAALPSDEAVNEISHKIQIWGKNTIYNNYLSKLNKSMSYYHGDFSRSGENHGLSYSGEQSELVNFPVNHYRNIGLHLLNMTTANRPNLKTRATNTDFKSQAQAILADGLLEYYFREKNLEDYIKIATEYAIVLGEGYVRMGWNSTAGQVVDEDEETGEKFYEGDLEFANLSPFDIVRDPSREDQNHEWLIVRTYKNRYSLVAKYPELEEAIMAAPSKDDLDNISYSSLSEEKTEDIPVYEFFHKKSDALPDGRYIVFVSSEAVLYDGPLPYRDIPVYRIAASNRMGTPFGYTTMFDLMPIQESINLLFSTVITNQNAFGVQNVMVPKGADMNLTQLAGGLNIIEYNNLGGKPEALNLTNTPAEIFNMLKMLEQQIETISGINSVTRGQPEASLRSAASLALIQAQAVQFSSSLQHSYTRLVENVGTGIIRILKDYAQYPRVAAIAGKAQRIYMKEFSSKDLTGIDRVTVETANTLAKTTAGRLEIANQLMQMGLVKNVDQYFTVLNTGKLENMLEGDQAELLLIRSENERMMDGGQVQALATDQHQVHVQEHKALLADPDLRQDPILAELVLNHITEHIELLRNTDPGLLAITRQQPLPPVQQPQEQGPPPGPEQIPQDGGVPPELQEAQTNFEAAQEQNLPNIPTPPAPFQGMPTNPANVPQEG